MGRIRLLDQQLHLSTYMSTLPDSAGGSRIFNKILENSCIDNFSRQERSFSRNFTITSWREIALDTVVFHTFRQSVMLPAWWKAVTTDQGYQNKTPVA